MRIYLQIIRKNVSFFYFASLFIRAATKVQTPSSCPGKTRDGKNDICP